MDFTETTKTINLQSSFLIMLFSFFKKYIINTKNINTTMKKPLG